MRTSPAPFLCASLLALACGEPDDNRDTQTSAGSITAITGITVTTPGTAGESTGPGGTTSASGATDSGAGTSSPTGSGATDSIKFDVGEDTGPNPDTTTGQATGCQKIDFLFVVDNSGSMAEEQAALVQSFPGFINSIQNTVMAEDYHLMVIDTDDASSAAQECAIVCSFPLPGLECGGYPCGMLPPPEECEASLGTGLLKDPDNIDCGVTGGHRYMVDGQPNLTNTFACLAEVGTNGSGSERPMEAMVAAISTLNGPGECNDGFLRKDALLVVTFMTDEEDDEESNGNPAGWNAALVAAKYGVQTSIVVLGLIGDPDQPNPVCTDGAEASPRLRMFAESFPFGSWGSICSADYAPFFDQAVSVIDTACQQFEPPG